MNWTKTTLTGLLAGSLMLAGCTFSNVDREWGDGYAANLEGQINDPNAGEGQPGVEGLDPQTAHEVAKRYYKGQRQQGTRRAPTVVISDE